MRRLACNRVLLKLMSTRVEGQPVQPSVTPAFLRVSYGWQARRRLSAEAA
jgi:hypothetical protein